MTFPELTFAFQEIIKKLGSQKIQFAVYFIWVLFMYLKWVIF